MDASRVRLPAPSFSKNAGLTRPVQRTSLERAWFRHGEIANGATLEFHMGDKPSAWGRSVPPPSPLEELRAAIPARPAK